MKTILVIEPHEEHKAPLEEAIKLSGEFNVIFFSSLSEFYDWLKKHLEALKAKQEEAQKITEIPLIIADSHAMKSVSTELLKKTKLMFVQQGLCSPENPLLFLITSFDDPDFESSKYFDPIYANIIYKPYDKLLLKEVLKYALEGRGPLSADLYEHKTTAYIELLKDVQICAISELGFKTTSKEPIRLGKAARYYSPLFEGNGIKSVFAYCTKIDEVSGKPEPEKNKKSETQAKDNSYLCTFTFFGTSREQLSVVRRNIRNFKAHETITLPDPYSDSSTPTVPVTKKGVIIIQKDPVVTQRFEEIVSTHFTNVEIISVKSLYHLSQYLPPEKRKDLPKPEREEALPDAEKYVIKFDKAAEFITDFHALIDSKEVPIERAFSIDIEDVKGESYFLRTLVNIDSYKELILFIKKNKPLSNVDITFKYEGDETAQIKVLESEHVTDAGNDYFTFTFRLLTDEEIFEKSNFENTLFNYLEAVFIDDTLFNEDRFNSVKLVIEKLKTSDSETVKYCGIHNQSIHNYELLEKMSFLDDYFCTPLDNFYLSRKLKQIFPQWKASDKEPLSQLGYDVDTTIKVALPLQIESIAESLLIFNYHRRLKAGEMRGFVLNSPGEKDSPEIKAMYNYGDKTGDDTVKCFFVLFGIRDFQLKHIRRWIKSQYIQSKK